MDKNRTPPEPAQTILRVAPARSRSHDDSMSRKPKKPYCGTGLGHGHSAHMQNNLLVVQNEAV